MANAGFVKGVACGMIVGTVTALIMDPISDRERNKIKKKTNGVFKSIGGVIDTVVDIVR